VICCGPETTAAEGHESYLWHGKELCADVDELGYSALVGAYCSIAVENDPERC
jgi:hypothetical protein